MSPLAGRVIPSKSPKTKHPRKEASLKAAVTTGLGSWWDERLPAAGKGNSQEWHTLTGPLQCSPAFTRVWWSHEPLGGLGHPEATQDYSHRVPRGVAIPPLQCPTAESPQWGEAGGQQEKQVLGREDRQPSLSLPMPSPLPSPSGNSGCLLSFASPIAGRGCSQMGGNNMPLHAPAEFPASLGKGMSACLKVGFGKRQGPRGSPSATAAL